MDCWPKFLPKEEDVDPIQEISIRVQKEKMNYEQEATKIVDQYQELLDEFKD